jgi:hypothetical protein
MMIRFIVYLRVSTVRQGASGLGIEAQREAVARHVAGAGGLIVAEVVETESGKRSGRPELARAIAACRAHRATLLIARLDRLARNVAFVAGLMESGVPFVAADMPTATPFMLHVYAAMAEAEGKAISPDQGRACRRQGPWCEARQPAARAGQPGPSLPGRGGEDCQSISPGCRPSADNRRDPCSRRWYPD